jgi:hypothetical protein
MIPIKAKRLSLSPLNFNLLCSDHDLTILILIPPQIILVYLVLKFQSRQKMIASQQLAIGELIS